MGFSPRAGSMSLSSPGLPLPREGLCGYDTFMDKKKETGSPATKSTIAIPVLRVLREYSDRDHPLSFDDFFARKLNEMGLKGEIHRHTFYDARDYLRGIGCDIQDAPGGGIYLGKRNLGQAEAARISYAIARTPGLPRKEKEAAINAIWSDQSVYVRKRALQGLLEAIEGLEEEEDEGPKEKEALALLNEASETMGVLLAQRDIIGQFPFIPMGFRIGKDGKGLEAKAVSCYPAPPDFERLFCGEEWIRVRDLRNLMKVKDEEDLDEDLQELVRKVRRRYGQILKARMEEELGLLGFPAKGSSWRSNSSFLAVAVKPEREEGPFPYVEKGGWLFLSYGKGEAPGENDARKAFFLLERKGILPPERRSLQDVLAVWEEGDVADQEALGAALVLASATILKEEAGEEEKEDTLSLAGRALERYEGLGEEKGLFYLSLLLRASRGKA